MTRERRFGYALFVLALGNGMLALGNLVTSGASYLAGFEALAALGLTAIAWSFVYGDSELAVAESSERGLAIGTALIAAVGVALAAAGFLMVATQ